DRRPRAASPREDRGPTARTGADPHRTRRRLPLSRPVRLPGGIIVRLAIALLVIVGGALLAAYVIVAPSLENRLVNAQLNGLEKSSVPLALARGFSPAVGSTVWQQNATIASVLLNSRVVVMTPLTQTPPTLTVGADSSDVGSAEVVSDPYALSASGE